MSQVSTSRRDFLKAAGLVAGAGVLSSLPTCRQPERKALPYHEIPKEEPSFDGDVYATHFPMPFWSESVLVKTYMGRPVKIEAKLGGGTSIYAQASIASLYSNFRIKNCSYKGKKISFEDALQKLDAISKIWRNKKGEELVIVKGYTNSFVESELLFMLLESMKNIKIVEYEHFDFSESFDYLKDYFECSSKALIDKNHKNIISFGCDFLATEALHADLHNGFDLSNKKIFSVSENISLTSERADASLICTAQETENIAYALYKALKDEDVGDFINEKQKLFVENIKSVLSKGNSIALASPRHSKRLHETVLAINCILSSKEKFPYYKIRNTKHEAYKLKDLIKSLDSGKVRDIVFIGNNFIDEFSKIQGLSKKISKLENKVFLGDEENETSALCDFVIPKKHFLESWSSAYSAESRILTGQPMIEPLYDSLSSTEFFARIAAFENFSDYEFHAKCWGSNFARGRGSVNTAISEGDATGANIPYGVLAASSLSFNIEKFLKGFDKNLSLKNFYKIEDVRSAPDRRFYDGRFKNNVWLQELPDVFTLKSWNDSVFHPWLIGEASKLFVDDVKKSPKLSGCGNNKKYSQWAFVIDLNKCTGCGACAMACQSENNLAIVGAEESAKGRAMHWLKLVRTEIDGRYKILPMMCLHCEDAPCESLCPVNASTHSENGISTVAYNRCIGARYCAMNCAWRLRKFNFKKYSDDSSLSGLKNNPEVSVRPKGVVEKCSFCVHRVNKHEKNKKLGIESKFETACSNACAFNAISIIDLNVENFPKNAVALLPDLNSKPRVAYILNRRTDDES